MTRKAILVVVTAAAIGTAAAYAVSYNTTIHWAGNLTSRRHVCIEMVQGSLYLHHTYSTREGFLSRVDAHEHGNQLKPRTGHVTYGGEDHSFVRNTLGPPDPDPGSVPMITYAWSTRIGIPMPAPLILLTLYPVIILVRGRLRRRMVGYDPRIKSTAARMITATVIGTFLIPVGYIPGGFIGFGWLHDIHGAPFWVAIPVVCVISFSPVICFAVWLFWRLTPGDHGGPLWRRRQRLLRERGLCLACGYDLTGNESGLCPECGRKIERG